MRQVAEKEDCDDMPKLAKEATLGNSQRKPAGRGHIVELDGLRGIAILMVIICHVAAPLKWGASFTELGSSGVCLFFVLSGYLITRLLLDEEGRTGKISLKRFYWRRTLRLVPAFWCYLLVLVVVKVLVSAEYIPWHSIAASVIYVRNIFGHGYETAHLWTLSLEEQFYIIWPLALMLWKSFRLRLWIILILVILTPVWRHTADSWQLAANAGVTYMRTDFRMDGIAVGCLLAMFESKRPNKLVARGLFLFVGASGLLWWTFIRGNGLDWGGLNYSMPCVFAAIIIYSQTGLSAPGKFSALGHPTLVHLGKLSYSLYLWQQLFIGPVEHFGIIRGNFILSFGLTLLFAWLSWRFVETPFMKFRELRSR